MDKSLRMRWTIPFAGFLLAFMGGFSYAWGSFVIPLVTTYNWTMSEASMPFSVFIGVFALMMFPAGRLQDLYGPRKIAALGAFLFLIAYGLASLVHSIPYSWWLLVTYGLLGGIACGLTYACIAPPASKWFPDKPGFAISSALTGFGLAAVFVAPLKADHIIPAFGVNGTLLIIGITAFVVCLFASLIIKDPPPHWKPETIRKHNSRTPNTVEVTPKELVKSPIFWTSWTIFAMVITGGLMCILIIPAYGELILNLSAVEAAGAIAVFAAFNGLGRPLAGFLSDRFGAVWVMLATYLIQSVTLLIFPVAAVNLPLLYILAALLGWGFAVTLALFPVLAASCFGTKHLGVNYGLLYSAFGAGALAPTFGALIFDATASYTPAFIIAGIMATVGLLLCLVLKLKYKLP